MRNILLLLSMLITQQLFSATNCTANITYSVGSIDCISISGDPATLSVGAATPGQPPTMCLDSSTSYAITTNNTGRNIYASLDSTLPTGVTLGASLVAPSGGTSASEVILTTTPQSLVSGVTNVAESGLTITYCLCATVEAMAVTNATNTVTYTVGP